MGALIEKRFALPNFEELGLRFIRLGEVAWIPLNWIPDNLEFLVPRLEVVEDGHSLRADNRQFLLFERVDPARVDVSAGVVREAEGCEGGVNDVFREVGLAGAINFRRRLIDKREDD